MARTQADRDDDLAIGREMERKDAEIERCYEAINQVEDLLGVAMAHLEGDIGYSNKQVVLDYLRAYFETRKASRSNRR